MRESNAKLIERNMFDKIAKRESISKKTESRFYSKFLPEIDRIWEERLLIFASQLLKESILLDVGCGVGKHHRTLMSHRRDIYLIGADISLESLKVAKTRFDSCERSNIDYVLCDVEALPFRDDSFGGLLTLFLLHHLPSLRSLHLPTLLKKGGHIFIVDNLAGSPLHRLVAKWVRRFNILRTGVMPGEHLDERGNLPYIKYRTVKQILATFTRGYATSINRCELYGGLIWWIVEVPILKEFFPTVIVHGLYNIERSLANKWVSKLFPIGLVCEISFPKDYES